MDSGQARGRIKEIIADLLSVDAAEIPDGASLIEDLGIDSLTLIEVGVDIEYEFQLEVADEELEQIRTVDDAVDLVLRHAGREAP